MAQPCGARTAGQSIDVGNAQSNASIWTATKRPKLGRRALQRACRTRTAFGDENRGERCLIAGSNDYLTRPVQPAELIDVMSDIGLLIYSGLTGRINNNESLTEHLFHPAEQIIEIEGFGEAG
jgi:CheY-like chemotaxis protein